MRPLSRKLFLLVFLAAFGSLAGAAGDAAGSSPAFISADSSSAGDGSSPSSSPSNANPSNASPSNSTANGSSSSSPAAANSSPADSSQPCVESVTPEGLRLTHLTAFTSCQGGVFQVALVRFAGAAGSSTDTTAVSGSDPQFLLSGRVQHRWLGPGFRLVEPKWIDVFVAVLRLSDGQLVTPKTVVPSAANPAAVERLDAIEDVRKACLLFEAPAAAAGGDGSSSTSSSTSTRFAQFKLRLTPDGSRVLGSDDEAPDQQVGASTPTSPAAATPAASGSNSTQGEEAGVACEQFTAAGLTATGRLVDVYRPGGCWFGVDACS